MHSYKSEKMTRRSFLKSIGVGAGVFLSGLTFSTSMLASPQTVVRLLTSETEPETVALFKTLWEQLERDYGIKVQADYLGFAEISKRLMRTIAAGNPPEVVGLPWVVVTEMAKAGQLFPVTDLAEKLEIDDYARIKWKGEDMWIPYALAPFGVIYREDIYNELGLKIADGERGKEWPTHLENLKAIQESGLVPYADCVASAFTGGSSEVWLANYGTTGGQVFRRDDEGELYVSLHREDKEKAVATLEYMKQRYQYSVPAGTFSWSDLLETFYTGKTAHTEYAGRIFTQVKRNNPDILDSTSVAFYPLRPGVSLMNSYGEAYWDGWGVIKGSKNPEAGKIVLKELVRGDFYIDFLHTVPIHLLPPREAIRKSKKWLSHPLIQRVWDDLQTFLRLLKHSRVLALETNPPNPVAGKVFNSYILGGMLNRVNVGEENPEKVVEETGEEIEKKYLPIE